MVVEPEREPPAISTSPLPPHLGSPHPGHQHSPGRQQTLPPSRAGKRKGAQTLHARTTYPLAQAEPYLRPGVPYIAPEEPPLRIGWAIFWRGLTLAVSLCLLSVLTGIAIVSLYCFIRECGALRKREICPPDCSSRDACYGDFAFKLLAFSLGKAKRPVS